MNIAIILSGGTGSRVGGNIPKQYVEVGGRTIISYCMETLFAHEMIDAVYIVADESYHALIKNDIDNTDKSNIFRGFSKPGANRQMSIYNALSDMADEVGQNDAIIIHDAARPLVSTKLISECIEAVECHDGVMPAFPVKDTVYASKDGKVISSLLNRSEIYAGQAPEIFKFGTYFKANKALIPDKILSICGSAEPAVLAGLDVVMIDGDEANYKITTQADLTRFAKMMAEKK